MLKILRRALITLISLALVAVGALAGWLWYGHPKRPVDSFLVRRAGDGVFTFADLPRGRPLTPDEADGYARRIRAEMTLQEKVLQLSGDEGLWDLIKLVTINPKYNDSPIPAGANRRLAIPPLLFSDGPRGVVLNHSTCFPVPMARAASWDPSLERRVGDVIGLEIRAQGGNLFGGVCVNLLRHPSWGRAQETYGEDPYLVGEMGVALARGVQAHNVMACAKHYALNSIEETRQTVDVIIDERTLREVYLPQFRRLAESDIAAFMSAYNQVNGEYCAESRHLLREILKEEWGFRGFVMSDFYMGVHDGAKAARAGLDLEMPWTKAFGRTLQTAVESGQVPLEVVDEAVLRLLRRKVEYATTPDPLTYGPELVRAVEHVTLAREVAEKGMVLLKNDGLLPLDRGRVGRLTIVGPLADAENLGDHGSSRVYPPVAVTPVEGLRAHVGAAAQVVYESGRDLARARELARDADVVLAVVGFTHSDEGEFIPERSQEDERGGDREELSLKASDRALIEAVAAENARTVVVLIGGAAITVEGWKDDVAAILMAFYPGEQGGSALARVLFGDVNPSGKLPFTVPTDASQLPPFDNRSETVEYGPLHGYTLADREGWEPAYPFGHGLSYTSYAYENLALAEAEVAQDGKIRASVDVTNTGSRAGDEIVQLYVEFPEMGVERPVKLLKAFERVHLEPGQKRRVHLVARAEDLARYDPEVQEWVVHQGGYRVLVGPSSRAIDLLEVPLRVVDRIGASASRL